MLTGNSKNRILLYSPIFFPDTGGPAIQGKYLAETLVDNGFEVYVLKYSKHNDLPTKFRIFSLNWCQNPNRLQRMYRWTIGPLISVYYLLRIRPKLVIVNSVFWNGMLVGIFCKIFKIPTILKFAGDWVFESSNSQKDKSVNFSRIYQIGRINHFLYLIEKFFINKFSVIWVISDFRKKNVQALSNSVEIWVQRNFHELPILEKPASSKFSLPLIFVTSARLIPHKRIDTLLKVVSNLKYDYKFIIVGEGPELSKLKILSTRLGISNKTFFLGKISSELLFEILNYSSIYLSWSAEEGAPNAFIEAMNFGLPIFTAKVGGIPEMFEPDSKAVKLIEPDDPNRLISELMNLENSLPMLHEMSKSAIIEGKKFLRSENESTFITFISNLMNSRK